MSHLPIKVPMTQSAASSCKQANILLAFFLFFDTKCV